MCIGLERICEMKFLKNFFNDDSKIIGLCGFDNMKPNYPKKILNRDIFSRVLQTEMVFETDFDKNILLL